MDGAGYSTACRADACLTVGSAAWAYRIRVLKSKGEGPTPFPHPFLFVFHLLPPCLFIQFLTISGNSHLRSSDAYSAEQVLLNKRQI